MGWRVAQDCDLGLTLAHGGGYPGYGSHVMLMPDHGTGVFALANRTYAGPSTPAWDTAVAMDKAGLLKARSIPVSPTVRSEEHTSELQSLMRISYAVFCLKKKKKTNVQLICPIDSETKHHNK